MLAALLACAFAARVGASIAYFPALLTADTHDSAGYIEAARQGAFQVGPEPSGYPLFLRMLHAASHELWVTIAVQHALGILSGLLLLLAARRLGAPRALALVPAAVVWLNGDMIFLEQAPLSEALFTFLLALAIYAAVRTLEGSRRWAAILGISSVGLGVTRTIGVPVAAVLICGVVAASWRLKLVRGTAMLALGCAVVMAGGYSLATRLDTGHWSFLAREPGWNLYMRAAEFAQCSKFTPPRGTRVLCESLAATKRPGPGYYRWTGGPAVRAFGVGRRDHLVRAFAVAAIVHQPTAFLGLVLTDVVRYVDPAFGRRRYDDYGGPATVRFPAGRVAVDPAGAKQVKSYYGVASVPSKTAPAVIRRYQEWVRFSGPMLLLAAILAVAGSITATGAARWGAALMTVVGFTLLLLPAIPGATWRYAIPAEGPFVCAATLGAWTLVGRARERRRSHRLPSAGAA